MTPPSPGLRPAHVTRAAGRSSVRLPVPAGAGGDAGKSPDPAPGCASPGPRLGCSRGMLRCGGGGGGRAVAGPGCPLRGTGSPPFRAPPRRDVCFRALGSSLCSREAPQHARSRASAKRGIRLCS